MIDSQPISAFQTLRPRMLAARGYRTPPPFPLDRPGTQYYYLARNGVFALARAWHLEGQEVLAPAYCHGVEMAALLHAGVDLKYFPVRAGMQVRPEDVIARVTPRTRAIYLIHYIGFPAPARELAEYCRDRKLLLIEDCALSFLTTIGDRPIGSFGDAGIFCLYKTLPLPNGGAVVVNTDQPGPVPAPERPPIPSTIAYTAAAIFRRAHLSEDAPNAAPSAGGEALIGRIRARVKPLFEKGLRKVGSTEFDPANLGLGMSGICHRALASQDFDDIVERRRRNYMQLLARLQGVADVVFPELPAGVSPLFFAIRTPHKLALRERLLGRGIETINFWFPQAPGVRPGEYPESDHLRATVLELPCHQDLSADAIDRLADELSRHRDLL